MFVDPTPDQLIAFAQLGSRRNAVSEYIEAQKKVALERLIGTRDADLTNELRGILKALEDFQTKVREAPAELEKLGRTAPL